MTPRPVHTCSPNASGNSWLPARSRSSSEEPNRTGWRCSDSAIELARREGAAHMDLGTSENDVAARALYERLGFSNREGRADGPINYFYERDL